MLTSLDFLQIGEPWPPEDPDTQARLELYKKNRQLFDSKAEQVYGRWVEVLRDNLEETHYVLNFHHRLAWLWADLIMGEPPAYKVGRPESTEQRALSVFVEENEVDTVGQEVLVDVSRYGDGLFRLRVEDGKPVIEGQSPEYWFPVVSESNVRKILYHVIAYKIGRTEKTNLAERALNPDVLTRRVRYLRAEVHSAGRIEHRLYRLNSDDRIEGRVEGDEVRRVVADFPGDADGMEETGVDVPLVFHAPGARTTDRLHGYDDYTKIDSSMEYLMWLAAQRQVILHKHSDPSISGPPIALVESESGKQYAASGSRYYQIEDGTESVRPEYMVWDGQLTGSFRQTEELWRDVFIASETSPTAFGHSESGYAESGTSLRLRIMATLKKSERMAQRFFPVLGKVLKIAGALGAGNFEALSITPNDGLPADEMEAAQITALDIGSGVTSKKAAMVRRYGYNDKQSEDELTQIEEERQQETPTVSVGTRLDLPATNGAGTLE